MPRHVKRSPSVTHLGHEDYVPRSGLEYDLGGHHSVRGAYGTRLQKRKSPKKKSPRRKKKSPKKKRKLSKLQRAHRAFMQKKLKALNKKGGKPTTNMKKAAKAWKKSPARRKAKRKSPKKKRKH